jgi:hypothetical protein
MSNAFNNFLGQMINGAGNPKGNLGDFAHASRLYVDDTFALAPKAGWMYYVVFNINQSALNTPAGSGSSTGGQGGLLNFIKGLANITDDWKVRRQPEIGMLVKSADLPKFAIQNEVVNQYNRKTYIQKAITYNPIQLSFHDDMSNVTHRLWTYYYKYYFADSNYGSGNGFKIGSKPAGYADTKYKTNSDIFGSTNYGLNNGAVEPFFDSIVIYQMNRKRFTSFILVNPMILQWDHDRLDQTSGNKMLENKATIGYENVLYGEGFVRKDEPSGFATFHYDLTPSPLSIAGGGNNSLFGPGGIVAGAGDIMGDLSNIANGNASPLSILGTALKTGNLVKNLKNVNGASVQGELFGLAAGGFRGVGGAISAGSGLALAGAGLAGAGLKLFKGDNKSANGTIQAKAKQVAKDAAPAAVRSDGSSVNSVLAGAAVAPDAISDIELPNPLPTDVEGLNFLIDVQTELSLDLQQQIDTNTALKEEYAAKIAEAQENRDDDALNAIFDELQQAGYTDPDLLQANLDKVSGNIDTLNSARDEAISASNSPDGLGEDGESNKLEVAQDESSTTELSDEETEALFAENNPDEEIDSGDVAWSDDEWPTEGWA